MADLTEQEAAELAALQAKQNALPVRTQTGLAGVLHKIVQWAVPETHQEELHEAVEAEVGAGTQAKPAESAQPSVFGTETTPETAQ